ncbi:CoA transferase [Pusillimonas sp. MFBS29]|uniref:CaiB/BaiF CoA transferase family protein n=1 Tax=Pusillimonas sp. MFBS29 TaxID=2886690 RepID=UPI001D100E82|nr:CaiB/BaiF CoA-transferase family protein [Pusillimonas sp. MFBS29]MCC2595612.1 CoA transferase [Pusillimonas sp. MFBS29]
MTKGLNFLNLSSVVADPSMQGVLSSVRVLDMSRLVAGNMLSLQLADFGADVIKVESPRAGDTLRHWQIELPEGGALDAWWRVYARNKRSLALELRDAGAREALCKLIQSAQVLIESFRPGTLEAMGFDPQSLHAINPKLIIIRVSGWGQTGPYKDLPGFGSLIEGFSGYAHKHIQPDGTPQLPNLALADMIAGLTGAFATLAALREVEVNGGEGQVVDLSLLEPMLAILGSDPAVYAATRVQPDATQKLASPRNVYRCRDGRWVALSGSTDVMARRVMEAIGHPALADDPRFSTNEARLKNDVELDQLVADYVKGMTQEECLELFRGKGVTMGPVYDTAQVLADPHIIGRECYLALGDDEEGVVMHNITPRLSRTPGSIRRPAPKLGQHTVEVLSEAGISNDEITAMQERGAVKCQ